MVGMGLVWYGPCPLCNEHIVCHVTSITAADLVSTVRREKGLYTIAAQPRGVEVSYSFTRCVCAPSNNRVRLRRERRREKDEASCNEKRDQMDKIPTPKYLTVRKHGGVVPRERLVDDGGANFLEDLRSTSRST